MAIIMGQAAVAGTVQIFTIPPGGCSVVFYSTVATGLYLGTSSRVTASNGYAVSTYPTSFKTFASSQGTSVYGMNTAATTLPVNYIISTEG